LLNVATPLTAVAVAVPTNVAPVLTVAVTTDELSLVTTLLPTSCNDTCGWVLNAAPDAVPTGVRTETTFVGAEVTTSALFADSDVTAPGDARVKVAALPAASTIEPPFSASAEVDA
jgi:hypothetical protein